VSYAQKIVSLLWAVAPDGATNGQIAEQFGIASHQTVYMLTQDLMRRGILRGER
jgi:DNA-binding transcriptional regulator LsrR (DeoR family)